MGIAQADLKIGDLYAITGVKQVNQITCVHDVAGSLNNKYFKLGILNAQLVVWFNVDAGGSAPSVVAGQTLVEVDIASGDSATTIAGALAAALPGGSFTSIVPAAGVVTTTDAAVGARALTDTGSTGFGLAVQTTGSGAGGTYECIDPAQHGTAAAFALAGNPANLLIQQTVTQSYAGLSYNTVDFDTIPNDSAKSYDGVSGYVFATPGSFALDLNMVMNAAPNGQADILAYVNGSAVGKFGSPIANPDGYQRFTGHFALKVNAGDKLTIVYGPADAGDSYNSPASANQLQIQQLW